MKIRYAKKYPSLTSVLNQIHLDEGISSPPDFSLLEEEIGVEDLELYEAQASNIRLFDRVILAVGDVKEARKIALKASAIELEEFLETYFNKYLPNIY